MKLYHTICIDSVRNLPLIASECSFNMACEYVNKNIEEVISVKSEETNNWKDMTYVITTQNFHFIYDESRGVLMKQEKELRVNQDLLSIV